MRGRCSPLFAQNLVERPKRSDGLWPRRVISDCKSGFVFETASRSSKRELT